MTFNQYVNNPYGASSISVQARESIKASYADKLDKLFLRENNKEFQRLMFKSKKSWYIFIKVPSETIPDFSYDVVIEFINPEEHSSLYDCEVRFFSNDPAFMYNAYVYNKNNLLIPDLKSKLPSESLKLPSLKNEKNIPGYIKSIYFAYLMCKRYGFCEKVYFESHAKQYTKSHLLSLVEHASDKLRDRQDKEAQYKEKKKNSKTISSTDFETSRNKKVQEKISKNIIMTKTTKFSGNTSRNVKRTKVVGRKGGNR